MCYSWWVLSSIKIIGKLHWINKEKIVEYILACQDDETGGFADRPGDMVSQILSQCVFKIFSTKMTGFATRGRNKQISLIFALLMQELWSFMTKWLRRLTLGP